MVATRRSPSGILIMGLRSSYALVVPFTVRVIWIDTASWVFKFRVLTAEFLSLLWLMVHVIVLWR